MQSNNNPQFVKCKICQENIPHYQMFYHQNECRQNHPDYVSIIQSRDQSRFQQNQSRVQQNQPQQQQQTQNRIIQNNQQVVSEINPSNISEKEFISYRRNPNDQMQSQTQAQRNAAQYTQSLLNNSSRKCEFCNDEYPNEILEEHYKCCEALIALQQYNDDENEILDQQYNQQSQIQYHNREQQQQTQNYYQQQQRHFQQQQHQEQQNQNPYYQNQSNIQYQNHSNYSHQSFQRNNNFSVRTTERMLPNGDFERRVEKTNLETGQTETTVDIIQRNQRNVNNNSFSQVSNNNLQQTIQNFLSFGPQRNIIFGHMNMLNSLFSNLNLRNKEDVFKNLAVIKFTPYNNLEPEYKQCSICFSDYEDGEELILLPCLHRFHSECLKKWFNEQTTCPICKLDVAEQEMQYEAGDDEDA